MWAREQYILDDVESNPLRCIANDETQRRQYFSEMSRAMATMCEGPQACVMDRDIENVYMDSIWGQVEFPRLTQTTNPVNKLVDRVLATNDLGDKDKVFWKRQGTVASQRIEKNITATARVGQQAQCGIPVEIAVEIDEGGKWPVDW